MMNAALVNFVCVLYLKTEANVFIRKFGGDMFPRTGCAEKK